MLATAIPENDEIEGENHENFRLCGVVSVCNVFHRIVGM